MKTTTTTCIDMNCACVEINHLGTLSLKDSNGDFVYITGISPEQWAKAMDLEQFKARLPEFV